MPSAAALYNEEPAPERKPTPAVKQEAEPRVPAVRLDGADSTMHGGGLVGSHEHRLRGVAGAGRYCAGA
jgi:hypothetical protein